MRTGGSNGLIIEERGLRLRISNITRMEPRSCGQSRLSRRIFAYEAAVRTSKTDRAMSRALQSQNIVDNLLHIR